MTHDTVSLAKCVQICHHGTQWDPTSTSSLSAPGRWRRACVEGGLRNILSSKTLRTKSRSFMTGQPRFYGKSVQQTRSRAGRGVVFGVRRSRARISVGYSIIAPEHRVRQPHNTRHLYSTSLAILLHYNGSLCSFRTNNKLLFFHGVPRRMHTVSHTDIPNIIILDPRGRRRVTGRRSLLRRIINKSARFGCALGHTAIIRVQL